MRSWIRRHWRWALPAGVVLAGVGAWLVFGFFAFQTYFQDDEVDEALPFFTAGPAPSGIEGDETTEDMAKAMNEAMAEDDMPMVDEVDEPMPDMPGPATSQVPKPGVEPSEPAEPATEDSAHRGDPARRGDSAHRDRAGDHTARNHRGGVRVVHRPLASHRGQRSGARRRQRPAVPAVRGLPHRQRPRPERVPVGRPDRRAGRPVRRRLRRPRRPQGQRRLAELRDPRRARPRPLLHGGDLVRALRRGLRDGRTHAGADGRFARRGCRTRRTGTTNPEGSAPSPASSTANQS